MEERRRGDSVALDAREMVDRERVWWVGGGWIRTCMGN